METIRIKVENIVSQKTSDTEKLHSICKLLKYEVEHYDWVGFYILDKEANVLYLGPYSGKATDHTLIPVGKGVCGQVAQNKETMIVQDVSKIQNYIACSMEVQSEIVVPVFKNGEFIAEIDIDSHAYAPFGEKDKKLLEEIAQQISCLF